MIARVSGRRASQGSEVANRHRNQSVARMVMSQPSCASRLCSRGCFAATSSCSGRPHSRILPPCGRNVHRRRQAQGSSCGWHALTAGRLGPAPPESASPRARPQGCARRCHGTGCLQQHAALVSSASRLWLCATASIASTGVLRLCLSAAYKNIRRTCRQHMPDALIVNPASSPDRQAAPLHGRQQPASGAVPSSAHTSAGRATARHVVTD